MALNKSKSSIIYCHSERGCYDTKKGQLCVESANLIDFFLEVFSKIQNSVLVIPISTRTPPVVLKLGQNTNVFNVPYPNIGEGKFTQLVATIRFIIKVSSKPLLQHIRLSDYSVSVGLSFVGTFFGLVRTVILKKTHSFIIRGNRLETIRQSSRGFLSKHFAMARILLYKRIMLYLLHSGKAELWFQGQEEYEEYYRKCNNTGKNHLFLLNAVLRDLPRPTKTFIGEKIYDIVFVGRMNQEKGIFDLIKAISTLSKEGFKCKAMFIGDGPDRTTAIELARRLHVNNLVKFIGYVSSPQKLAALISQAKLFVLPSYTEGLPRTMVESMSLGVPGLFSPVGGIKYVIRNGENGFLVEPGSSLKLARKIKEIIELIDSKQITQIIKNARHDAEEFSFSCRAKYFLEHSINQSSGEELL